MPPHRTSLTQLGAERLRPSATEQVYWDTNLKGFGLRVSPKGKKTFLVQFRVRGPKGSKWKERQVKLGELSFMTVSKARARAGSYKSKASEGIDPVDELKAAQQAEETKQHANAFTFAKLVERYEAEYLVHRKPRGIEQKTRLFKRLLPVFGDKPVSEIREADILAFINGLLQGRAGGRHEADHLVGAIRHAFVWAKKHQHDQALKSLVAINPAIDMARFSKPGERDRYLDHSEIRKFWVACSTVGWPGGHILQLLLLTGQRENEIAQLRWSELNLTDRVWNLPAARAKNSKAHIVHFSDLAMEIINALPHIDGSPLVFTTNGRNPFTNFHRLRDRVHHLMGEDVPHWQIRDLRRTATTLLAQVGVDHHVCDKILNHVGGKISGTAAIYNRHQYLPERQLALEALGRKIAQLIGRTDNVVVPLRA